MYSTYTSILVCGHLQGCLEYDARRSLQYRKVRRGKCLKILSVVIFISPSLQSTTSYSTDSNASGDSLLRCYQCGLLCCAQLWADPECRSCWTGMLTRSVPWNSVVQCGLKKSHQTGVLHSWYVHTVVSMYLSWVCYSCGNSVAGVWKCSDWSTRAGDLPSTGCLGNLQLCPCISTDSVQVSNQVCVCTYTCIHLYGPRKKNFSYKACIILLIE